MKSPALLLKLPAALPLCLFSSVLLATAQTKVKSTAEGSTAPAEISSPAPETGITAPQPPRVSSPDTTPPTPVAYPVQDPETMLIRTRESDFLRLMRLVPGEFWVVPTGGTPYSQSTGSTTNNIAELQEEATNLQNEIGGEVELFVDIDSLLGSPVSEAAARRVITRRLIVAVTKNISNILAGTGATNVVAPEYSPGVYVVDFRDPLAALEALRKLELRPGVVFVEPSYRVPLVSQAYVPTDTYFNTSPTVRNPPHNKDRVINSPDPELLIANLPVYQWNMKNTGISIPLSVLAFPKWGDPLKVAERRLAPVPPETEGALVVRRQFIDLRADYAFALPGINTTGRGSKVMVIDSAADQNHGVTNREWGVAAGFDINNSVNMVEKNIHPTTGVNMATQTAGTNTLDSHGTSMLGLIGARQNRTSAIGMVGVARECDMMAARITLQYSELKDIADVLAWNKIQSDSTPEGGNGLFCDEPRGASPRVFDVACVGFTAPGGGGTWFPFGQLIKDALAYGARNVRSGGGRGIGAVYVTPSGNYGEYHQNTNYTELTSNLNVIVVGGVTDMGRRVGSSCIGANVMVAAPTGTDGRELPPVMSWPSAPGGWASAAGSPANLTLRVEGYEMRPDRFPLLGTLPLAPYGWVRRRPTTILTTKKANAYDYQFGGTSASCASVSGAAALILGEAERRNVAFSHRDVMEILMRSARMTNDVRYTANRIEEPAYRRRVGNVQLPPSTWSLSNMGKPFHYAFGTGVVDLERALLLATSWVPLPPRKQNGSASTLARQNDPCRDTVDFDVAPGQRSDIVLRRFDSLEGGERVEVTVKPFSTQTINGVIKYASKMEVPPPPNGMRVEQVRVYVEFYHGRRGDLSFVLKQPPSDTNPLGVISVLAEPNREDYQAFLSDAEPFRDNPCRWAFSTVRHWGFRSDQQQSEGDVEKKWELIVTDEVSRGATRNTTNADPYYCPVENPTGSFKDQGGKIKSVRVTYYGGEADTYLPADPPFLPKINESNEIVVSQGTRKIRYLLPTTQYLIVTGDVVPVPKALFPVTEWNFFDCPSLERLYVLKDDYVPSRQNLWYTTADSVSPLIHGVPIAGLVREQAHLGVDAGQIVFNPAIASSYSSLNHRELNKWLAYDTSKAYDTGTPPSMEIGLVTEAMKTNGAWGMGIPDASLPPLPYDPKAGVLPEVTPPGYPYYPLPIPLIPPPPETLNTAHPGLLDPDTGATVGTGAIEFTPAVPGKYRFTVVATSLTGASNPREYTINVVPPGYPGWSVLYISDPAKRGKSADPDNDGLSNLMEYALGLNPTVDTNPLPPEWQVDSENNELVFRYFRVSPLLDPNLQVFGQVSTDLVNWTPAPAPEILEEGGKELLETRIPITPVRKYFRVKVVCRGS